ncbi:MAG: hypothetical protein D6744_17495 [Planctomycetota bacterium]|nr:MAG: hypothetical protein D6744_17495 [Planctomycetota bacterium]
MAVYSATLSGVISVASAVASPGKRVRIRRLIVTTAVNGSLTLKQDIGGADETAVFPTIQARAQGPALDLYFDREMPQTAPGLALGFESGVAGDHGIWIEYDLVD